MVPFETLAGIFYTLLTPIMKNPDRSPLFQGIEPWMFRGVNPPFPDRDREPSEIPTLKHHQSCSFQGIYLNSRSLFLICEDIQIKWTTHPCVVDRTHTRRKGKTLRPWLARSKRSRSSSAGVSICWSRSRINPRWSSLVSTRCSNRAGIA